MCKGKYLVNGKVTTEDSHSVPYYYINESEKQFKGTSSNPRHYYILQIISTPLNSTPVQLTKLHIWGCQAILRNCNISGKLLNNINPYSRDAQMVYFTSNPQHPDSQHGGDVGGGGIVWICINAWYIMIILFNPQKYWKLALRTSNTHWNGVPTGSCMNGPCSEEIAWLSLFIHQFMGEKIV